MAYKVHLDTCPFCGGEAEIVKVQNKGQKFYVSWVDCTQCRCSTLVFNTRREAAATWNRRTAQ